MEKDFKLIESIDSKESYTFKFTKEQLWWIRASLIEARDSVKKPRPCNNRMVTEEKINKLYEIFGWK